MKSIHAVLLSLFTLLTGLALTPTTANAATAQALAHAAGTKTFTTQSYILGPWAFGAFIADDGVVSYCAEYKMGPPGGIEGGSASYSKGYDVVGGAIAYILKNGYPTKTTISGDSFSDLAKPAECARAATQLALWMYTGDMTLTGDYVKDGVTKNAITVCNGSERSKRCVAAAAALCKEALLHENDYANVYVARWTSPDGSTQSMYYGIPISYTSSLNLSVSSSYPEMTNDNAGYSFEGTEYTLYSDSSCSKSITTAKSASNGSAIFSKVPVGNFYVKQTKAGAGYVSDASVKQVSMPFNSSVSISFVDDPQYAAIDPIVTKIDEETGSTDSLGSSSLDGAEFTITYTKTGSTSISATWIARTDSSGKATIDESRSDTVYKIAGNVVYPIGQYAITESEAPSGYLINAKEEQFDVTADASSGTVLTKYASLVFADEPIRGDIRFTKVDDETDEPLSGIPFKITSKTTGEYHIVFSDEKGVVDTSVFDKHVVQNEIDAGYESSNDSYSGQESFIHNVWFSGGNAESSKVYEKGCLPFDTYVVQELSINSNWSYQLVEFEFTVSTQGTQELGIVSNKPITLSTIATNAKDGTQTIPYSDATIEDDVFYEGLRIGETYMLQTSIMAINDDGTVFQAVDELGNPVTNTLSFIPTERDSHVTSSVQLSPYEYAGMKLVVYESLYYEGELIAAHDNPEDEQQQVTVGNPAALNTCATFSNGSKTSEPGSLTIVDEVNYLHLNMGSYVMIATLYDKETKSPLLTIDGEQIQSELEFTIFEDDSNGTLEINIPLDARHIDNSDIVVFERVYLVEDGVSTLVAYHEDIDDDYQTVSIKSSPIELFDTLPSTGGISILSGIIAIGSAMMGVGVVQIRKHQPKRPDIY